MAGLLGSLDVSADNTSSQTNNAGSSVNNGIAVSSPNAFVTGPEATPIEVDAIQFPGFTENTATNAVAAAQAASTSDWVIIGISVVLIIILVKK